MTIPIQPANVNPQVHKTEDPFIQQFMAALLQGSEMAQRQQSLQLQREELKQRQAEHKAKEQEFQAQQLMDARIGEVIRTNLLGQMEPGQVSTPALPGGAVGGFVPPMELNVPTGPTARMVRELPAQAVPKLREPIQAQIQAEQQGKAEQEFLASLPEGPIREGQRLAMDALRGGAGREQAADLASTIMRQVDPKILQGILAEFPELVGLPPDQIVAAFVETRKLQMQRRLGIGPEGERQARLELNRLRKEEARVRISILQANRDKPDDKTLQSVLAYLRVVDQALDPLNLALQGLTGKPKMEQVEALFGAQGRQAYERAVQYLQGKIPATETP